MVSGTTQVYRVGPNGTNPTRLTTPSGQIFNECPSWAADGRLVYFDRVDRSSSIPAHIYRMNASGSSRVLADDETADGSLDWGVGAAPPRCLGRRATIRSAGGGLIRGTPGNDVIVGSPRADRISSGGGRDLVCSRGGADRVKTGAGADRVLAGTGDDLVITGSGADRVRAGSGSDRVRCGAGNDRANHVGADRLSRCERVRRG